MPDQSKNNSHPTVENISLDVLTEEGFAPLIRNVYFSPIKGMMLGITSESDIEKTITCLSLTELLLQPPIFYIRCNIIFGVKIYGACFLINIGKFAGVVSQ